MKKIAFSVAVAIIAIVPAKAADMAVKAPLAPAPLSYNWTGLYLGGFVGGAFGASNTTATETGSTGGVFPVGVLYNVGPAGRSWGYGMGSSVIAGGTLGYNWQAPGSALVLGLEGELSYIHLTGAGPDPLSPALDTVTSGRIGDWYGLIAARLGWAVNNWLIYAKGGVAWVGLNANTNDVCTVAPCGGGLVAATGSKTTTALALGGGAEWALTKQWSVKAEYLYLAISDTVAACGPGAGTAAGSTFCWNQNFGGVHTAKLGVNFHF